MTPCENDWMSTIASHIQASTASGLWSDERINDDRVHVDAVLGLAVVADASGPTYGGYYAPFAIDLALEALVDTFRRSSGSTRARLETAMRVAHDAMRGLNACYERRLAGRVGLEAAREAADSVRPPRWRGYDSLAHFMGSVTACGVGADGVVIAQVGGCRAYGIQDDVPTLLALDHTLPSVLEASGAPSQEVDVARQEHATVVGALLGGETLQMNVVDVSAITTIGLVTMGVWRNELLLNVLRATDQNELAGSVRACAETSHHDASAAIVHLG